MNHIQSFATQLDTWLDRDSAMHLLAQYLGIVDTQKGSFQVEYKWIYFANNPYGNFLFETLMKMVKIGLLELGGEDMDMFRANPDFEVNNFK